MLPACWSSQSWGWGRVEAADLLVCYESILMKTLRMLVCLVSDALRTNSFDHFTWTWRDVVFFIRSVSVKHSGSCCGLVVDIQTRCLGWSWKDTTLTNTPSSSSQLAHRGVLLLENLQSHQTSQTSLIHHLLTVVSFTSHQQKLVIEHADPRPVSLPGHGRSDRSVLDLTADSSWAVVFQTNVAGHRI